ASHQSEEHFDATKCHPEIRTAVLNKIMSWVNSEEPNEQMMWLRGPAGAGKSLIAQTVSEICHNESKLLSSFFFSRMAAGRSDGNRLVPTIAYQLATTVPEVNGVIIDQMQQDPGILKHSMEIQMQRLILQPLSWLETDVMNVIQDSHIPYLVVIDGLDECQDCQMQSRIITVISSILVQLPLAVDLLFLITSRPEFEI
ncbi:hypothetical protein BDQ17DRAFT_1257017, partial [Cyathus striatus]